MALYEFEGIAPTVGASSFVHSHADVIGDVVIGENCWIGPGVRIRGDTEQIVIGDGTSIQDNCVIHTRDGMGLTVGSDVTVGHCAVLHSCTIEDKAIVGMGAIVTDGAVVGSGAIVAEGAVVKARLEVPANSIVAGVPAKVVGEVKPHQRENVLIGVTHYIDMCTRYKESMHRIDEG